jgi:hypothetical protein
MFPLLIAHKALCPACTLDHMLGLIERNELTNGERRQALLLGKHAVLMLRRRSG